MLKNYLCLTDPKPTLFPVPGFSAETYETARAAIATDGVAVVLPVNGAAGYKDRRAGFLKMLKITLCRESTSEPSMQKQATPFLAVSPGHTSHLSSPPLIIRCGPRHPLASTRRPRS